MPEPPIAARLRCVLRPHWRRLAGVQALGVAQQVLWVVEPFVFGRALDALIGQARDRDPGDLLEYLAWWSGVFFANSACGVPRRGTSESTHSRLYAEVCTLLSRAGIADTQREEHDLREHNFEVFASGDPERVAQHFGAIARVRTGAARWSALNFGAIRAAVLGIFVTVLWIAIDIDAFTTGAIYSIVSYIWTFVTYAEDVPTLFEASSSLRDLDRRFAST